MKIFVIDDSAMYRGAITKALAEPDLKLIGTAANGKIGLEQLKSLKDVDLVICDMEMPEMDGLEFIKKFREINRTCKVLVFSSLSERGAKVTIDALLAGANDFLPKSFGNKEKQNDPLSALKENLLPKVRQFKPAPSVTAKVSAASNHVASNQVAQPVASAKFEKNAGFSVRPDVICIGSSTGGPDALKALMSGIKEGFPVPILIAQHMPAMFTKELAKLLDKNCVLTVKEAEEGEAVLPGHVYIAPGDYHMKVKADGAKKILVMDQGEKVNYVRPAVDLLFKSVADVYGKKSIAVVLTGMGQDGLDGVVYMKNAHNTPVIIQSKETCVVFGMPGAIHQAGVFDQMLPLLDISSFLNRQVFESIATRERVGA